MLAAVGGHVNVLKTLIENKADVNVLTKVYTCTAYNCVHTITIHVTHFILYYIQRDLVLYVQHCAKESLSYNNYGRREDVYTCIYT